MRKSLHMRSLVSVILLAVWADRGDTVAAIREQDFLGGFLMGGYGINDGLLFAAVAIKI